MICPISHPSFPSIIVANTCALATYASSFGFFENNKVNEIESINPTAEVQKLISRFSGEVPQLQVIRPNLEDIYLEMIGEKV